MTKSFLFLLLVAFAVTHAATSRAGGVANANFLANASFDDGLLGWTVNDPTTVDWVVDYSFPPPDSDGVGAAAVFKQGIISQCISGVSEGIYSASAWVRSECSNSTPVVVNWYTSTDCSGLATTGSVIALHAGSNAWQLLKDNVIAPGFTQSANFDLDNQGGCTQAIFFEDAFFGDSIFADSFD